MNTLHQSTQSVFSSRTFPDSDLVTSWLDLDVDFQKRMHDDFLLYLSTSTIQISMQQKISVTLQQYYYLLKSQPKLVKILIALALVMAILLTLGIINAMSEQSYAASRARSIQGEQTVKMTDQATNPSLELSSFNRSQNPTSSSLSNKSAKTNVDNSPTQNDPNDKAPNSSSLPRSNQTTVNDNPIQNEQSQSSTQVTTTPSNPVPQPQVSSKAIFANTALGVSYFNDNCINSATTEGWKVYVNKNFSLPFYQPFAGAFQPGYEIIDGAIVNKGMVNPSLIDVYNEAENFALTGGNFPTEIRPIPTYRQLYGSGCILDDTAKLVTTPQPISYASTQSAYWFVSRELRPGSVNYGTYYINVMAKNGDNIIWLRGQNGYTAYVFEYNGCDLDFDCNDESFNSNAQVQEAVAATLTKMVQQFPIQLVP